MLFDTSKLRALVPEFTTRIPFWEGAREIIGWYDANPDHQVVNHEMDAAFDRLSAHTSR